MARIARIVAPGFPHYVTQRGNRGQKTFFDPSDYEAYVELMSQWCDCHGVEVLAYCLMPNHAHLIVTPRTGDGLRKAIGEAHRRYTRRINFSRGWRGHLWQGRFASYPMDNEYVPEAVKHVELNPVRSGLVKNPEDYPWSSARAHATGVDDGLTHRAALRGMVSDWAAFLQDRPDQQAIKAIRRHERTGRPLGNDTFLDNLENKLRRVLRPGRPGRKPMARNNDVAPLRTTNA